MTMAVTRTKRKMTMLKVMRVMVGLAAGPKEETMLWPAMLPLSDLTEPLLGFFGLVAVLLQAKRMMKKTRAARAMRQ